MWLILQKVPNHNNVMVFFIVYKRLTELIHVLVVSNEAVHETTLKICLLKFVLGDQGKLTGF